MRVTVNRIATKHILRALSTWSINGITMFWYSFIYLKLDVPYCSRVHYIPPTTCMQAQNEEVSSSATSALGRLAIYVLQLCRPFGHIIRYSCTITG